VLGKYSPRFVRMADEPGDFYEALWGIRAQLCANTPLSVTGTEDFHFS